jgi:iron complex outermembrane receptor protein
MLCLTVTGVIFLLMQAVFAEEGKKTVVLSNVHVTAERLITPTKETGETVYTGSEITRKGIEAEGTKATVSVYEAINVIPGVTVEGVDPYGLAAEQKNIRIRGVRGYSTAMTVEGVPNWGGNPMGPREYIYDTEDLEGIAVYKGAIPADLGTGVGARGGAIDLKPRWPEKKFGVDYSQGIGAHKYNRCFVRLDTGALPAVNTCLAGSFSYTDADKWKGPGELGPRKNVNAMLKQPLWSKDELKVWFNYNDLTQDLYRPLTYAETRSLHENYEKDYNDSLTGIRSQDINYYRYNSGEYVNRDLLAVVPLTLSDIFRVTVKPYASSEKTKIFGGVASQGGMIQQRGRDTHRYGLISQADATFPWVTASLGYWIESNDMIISTKNYNPVNFAFSGYGMYTDNGADGLTQSPFVTLSGKIGGLDWQGGLKYFYYKDPSSQGYTSAAPTFILTPAPDLFREAKEYDEFLPTAGLGYHITENLEVYTDYGRNQIRPYAYMPLINLYNQNRAAFRAAGVTLDDMFNGYDMEISDNFEWGARFRSDVLDVMPVVFFSKHKNLLTTVYDPRVNQSYYQNMGGATGYGCELETNLYAGKNITLFFNPACIDFTYDGDMTFQGNTMYTDGKQVVDTPKWTFKTGAILTFGGFEVVPMARFLGARYGDAQHEERVDDYIVADLKISYTRKKVFFAESVKVSLELNNICDTEYISVINSMDDNRAGNTSYNVGAPFTTMFTVKAEF